MGEWGKLGYDNQGGDEGYICRQRGPHFDARDEKRWGFGKMAGAKAIHARKGAFAFMVGMRNAGYLGDWRSRSR